MVKVNLKNGQTLTFDLASGDGREQWAAFQNDALNQTLITGIGIFHDKTLHVLTQPRGFRKYAYYADAIWDMGKNKVMGEQLQVQADDIQFILTIYFNQTHKLTRTDIRRIGKPRYLTDGRPMPVAHSE